MDNFFNGNGKDRCTLGSDRFLINRRNVMKEVKKRYSACKSFLSLALEARIIAATLTLLQIDSMEDEPCNTNLPSNLSNASKAEKKTFIGKLAENVVDKYIMKKKEY